MRATEFLNESAISELVKKLPSLNKHDYNALEKLVHEISKKHKISKVALHKIFNKKFNKSMKDYLHNDLENIDEESNNSLNIEKEVDKFVDWMCRRLHLTTKPEVELSYDTTDAQDNHHTGRHTEGENSIWVYAKNRNLVDILRTVAHEMVHVRQSELNMIKPGDSYPGSPIEVLADMVAGKWIKVYGEKNHYIFQ